MMKQSLLEENPAYSNYNDLQSNNEAFRGALSRQSLPTLPKYSDSHEVSSGMHRDLNTIQTHAMRGSGLDGASFANGQRMSSLNSLRITDHQLAEPSSLVIRKGHAGLPSRRMAPVSRSVIDKSNKKYPLRPAQSPLPNDLSQIKEFLTTIYNNLQQIQQDVDGEAQSIPMTEMKKRETVTALLDVNQLWHKRVSELAISYENVLKRKADEHDKINQISQKFRPRPRVGAEENKELQTMQNNLQQMQKQIHRQKVTETNLRKQLNLAIYQGTDMEMVNKVKEMIKLNEELQKHIDKLEVNNAHQQAKFALTDKSASFQGMIAKTQNEINNYRKKFRELQAWKLSQGKETQNKHFNDLVTAQQTVLKKKQIPVKEVKPLPIDVEKRQNSKKQAGQLFNKEQMIKNQQNMQIRRQRELDEKKRRIELEIQALKDKIQQSENGIRNNENELLSVVNMVQTEIQQLQKTKNKSERGISSTTKRSELKSESIKEASVMEEEIASHPQSPQNKVEEKSTFALPKDEPEWKPTASLLKKVVQPETTLVTDEDRLPLKEGSDNEPPAEEKAVPFFIGEGL